MESIESSSGLTNVYVVSSPVVPAVRPTLVNAAGAIVVSTSTGPNTIPKAVPRSSQLWFGVARSGSGVHGRSASTPLPSAASSSSSPTTAPVDDASITSPACGSSPQPSANSSASKPNRFTADRMVLPDARQVSTSLWRVGRCAHPPQKSVGTADALNWHVPIPRPFIEPPSKPLACR